MSVVVADMRRMAAGRGGIPLNPEDEEEEEEGDTSRFPGSGTSASFFGHDIVKR